MARTAWQNLLRQRLNLGTACNSLNIVGHLTYLSNSNASMHVLLKTAHLVIYALSRFTLIYTRHD